VAQRAGGLRDEQERPPEPPTQPAGRPTRSWTPGSPTLQAAGALVLYLTASILLFGVPIVSDLSGRYVGWGADPASHVWFLAWWPHALIHGTNPFITHAVWAPSGYDLAGSTGVPGPSLVLAPLTALAGPVVSYNVLATLIPAIDALAAFVAFRRWVSPPAALLGGLVFGWGSSTLAQLTQHPFLALTATAPLILVLLDGLLLKPNPRPARDGMWLGLIASAQLLINEEILAMEAVLSICCLMFIAVHHYPLLRSRRRQAVVGLRTAAAITLAVGAVPLSIQFFGPYRITSALHPTDVFVADAASVINPNWPDLVRPHIADRLNASFTGNWTEWGDYLGIPFLLLLVWGSWTLRRRAIARLAVLMTLVTLVLSFGAHLHVDGRETGIPLPWSLVGSLPVLRDILPSRLSAVLWLGVALLVAVVADETVRRRQAGFCIAAGLLVAASIITWLPMTPYRSTAVRIPSGLQSHAVCPRHRQRTVAVFPFEDYVLLWQAHADFCYRTTNAVDFNGTAQNAVAPLLDTAIQDATRGIAMPPADDATAAELADEVRRQRLTAILVGPASPPGKWKTRRVITAWLTREIGTPPRRVGDLSVWSFAPR